MSSICYPFDRAGRRTHATREDGTNWRYEYNARGEVTNAAKLLPDQTALAGQQFAYLYDDIGNRTSARYGGGTGTNAGPEREISYTLNALNQYSSISHPQTANILGLSDEGLGPVTVSGQLGATDQQGSRFRAEVGTTDPDGEWVEVEVAQGNDPPASQGSRWIPGATVQRFHDDDGNLLNDGRWKYTWDAENRLTRLEPTPEALAGGHPDHVLEFAYDHLSRRIRKRVIDRANNDAVLSDRRFLYDGWNLIAEFEASPQNSLDPVAYHAWAIDLSGTPQGAGGVGGLYASHVKRPSDGTWENYFPTYDGNGNIIAWINEQGQVAQRLDYDAFGNILTKQGTLPGGVELNFGFSTKYQDQRTGLLYYGYRYFDPVTGRWPSRDPIGERGGINLYGMVGNDPVCAIDKLGLEQVKAYINIHWGRTGNTRSFTRGMSWGKPIDFVRQKTLEDEADWSFRLSGWGDTYQNKYGQYLFSPETINQDAQILKKGFFVGSGLKEVSASEEQRPVTISDAKKELNAMISDGLASPQDKDPELCVECYIFRCKFKFDEADDQLGGWAGVVGKIPVAKGVRNALNLVDVYAHIRDNLVAAKKMESVVIICADGRRMVTALNVPQGVTETTPSGQGLRMDFFGSWADSAPGGFNRHRISTPIYSRED